MLKIYIANLAKYNEGILKGEWLELPADEETIKETLEKVLGNDEEYAIHDFESDIDGVNVKEYSNVYSLNVLAERLEKAEEEHGSDLLSAAIREFSDIDEALEKLDAGDFSYYVNIDSKEDLGYAVVDEGLMGDIPKHLKNYIDYEAIGRDMCLEGWTIYPEYNIAVCFY